MIQNSTCGTLVHESIKLYNSCTNFTSRRTVVTSIEENFQKSMELLWRTVDGASDTQLINIFEKTRQNYGRCFSEWNEYINSYAHRVEISKLNKKSNTKAKKLLDEGHNFHRSGNYRCAMQKYNECLGYAEPNAVWER